jgi:hypothetical protein
MVRSLTKRGMPKPFAILIAALLALYFVPFIAAPAQAVTVGGFEIEGNLADDAAAGIDWANLSPGQTGFATDVDHTTGGQDDTTFGGGSKEYQDGQNNGWDHWDFGGGNAPSGCSLALTGTRQPAPRSTPSSSTRSCRTTRTTPTRFAARATFASSCGTRATESSP